MWFRNVSILITGLLLGMRCVVVGCLIVNDLVGASVSTFIQDFVRVHEDSLCVIMGLLLLVLGSFLKCDCS